MDSAGFSQLRRMLQSRDALIAILILAVGAAAGVWLLLATIDTLSQLDPNVLSAVVAALAGVVVVVLGQIFNRSRQIEEAHRDRKVEIYAKFGQFLIDLQQATKRGEEELLLESEQTYNFFVDFNRDILLWASPRVIRAFLDFRIQRGIEDTSVLVKMDSMLLVIRKDLGLSNRRLRRGDLVKLFLKDPNEFDKMLGR